MTQYQEYRPKKPRNLALILFAGITVLILIGSVIAYAILVSGQEESAIDYPEKISVPAAEAHSSFQMEENIISDTFAVDEAEIDALEDMLFADYIDETTKETPIVSDKEVVSPTPVEEIYKPSFVATPSSPQWMTNAVAMGIDPTKPMVAIVIDDLGIDKRRTQQTIDLPAPLNLAFLPYPTQLPEQTKTAREAGHELIVHMPMEPSNLKQNNPGPHALLTQNSNAVNLENLKNSLEQFDGYVGINNHMGSRFTTNYNAMGPILEELKRRGLLFLDSRTIGGSQAEKLSQELDLPFVSRDVFLDHDPSRAGVDASLAKTLRVAKNKGTAIAIGHPKDNTIAALKAWIPQAKAQGVQIVPLTAIAYKRMGIKQKELTQTSSLKEPEKKTQESVTVTIGDDKSYDGILWNAPENLAN